MKIKQIKLSNFSSYVGETLIELDTQAEKNIVLVGGNNGAGKTSLFTAIKLALYGPQSFRFQDKNNQYTARIKDLINHDAYMDDRVTSYVELTMELPSERKTILYTLHRAWSYKNKRLSETYTVIKDGMPLPKKEQDFFQNYLFTLIPPNMFDFFFFDGEEIADFFTTGSYNTYIKNAVLTLCRYDTFQLIQKFCNSYTGIESGNAEYETVKKKAGLSNKELQEINERIPILETELERTNELLSSLEVERQNTEAKFENAGGLSDKEKTELQNRKKEQEQLRKDCTKAIRDFAENLMPLYITAEQAHAAAKQLDMEREMQNFQAVSRQISKPLLKQVLAESGLVQDADALSAVLFQKISNELRPKPEQEPFITIHDLSLEQKNQFDLLKLSLHHFDAEMMIKTCKEKQLATQRAEMYAKQLKEALPDEDANTFLLRIEQLRNTSTETKMKLEQIKKDLEFLYKEQAVKKKQNFLIQNELEKYARDKAAHVYTRRISGMMQSMIQDTVQNKFQEIERLTMEMFQKIIRKENFLALVELDDHFNIHIYKKQSYSTRELALLMQNLGGEEFSKRLGTAGIKKILRRYQLTSTRELKKHFKKYMASEQVEILDDVPLDLYKRMELNQLSKGEKQVFVLSLYWAIIKSSGQSVPFVIDTPYARIDTEHREQITKLFFPFISDQVIIFSTDEEVIGPYRDYLQPKIAQEYLLDYQKGRTIVSKGYFKEGTV